MSLVFHTRGLFFVLFCFVFAKGVFVQEGSSGTRFEHDQFEIKTFPIYAPPYYISAFPDQSKEEADGGKMK